MTKLRILLADDHAVVREGLKALVNAQPDMEVIGEASDGTAAWRLAVELHPDVVVMDVSMPGSGGAAATERICRDCSEIRVIAFTVHEVAGYLRQLPEAGAAGYVLKRAAAEDLVRAVRAVATGGVYLDPKLAGQVVAGFVSPETQNVERRKGSSPTGKPRSSSCWRGATSTAKSPKSWV